MKEKFCDENRQGRAAYLLRCGKMPRRNQALVIALVIAGLLFAIVPVSAGSYSYDGVSLTDATHGTVQGTVVCDKGSNYGLKAPWFNTTFSVPGGSSVKWAKIYVSVWGGTENYVGWANGTITNVTGTYTLTPSRIDKNAPGSNVIGSGNGKWIASHDVTSYLNPGQTFVANISTTGTIDKRVYDVTLVAVIVNASESKTAYWINDGNVNERYDAGYGELNNNITTFAAPSYDTTEAKVCLGQLVGTSGESDFAYFNVPDDTDTPRDLTNIDWDLTTHRKYQIGTDDDLADSNSDGTPTSYFDLDHFTTSNDSTALKNLVNLRGDNDVIFWRGHDYDGSGVIEGTWGASDSEGETYVTPFLAVLTLKDISRVYDFNSSTLGTPGTDLYAYEGQVSTLSNTTPTTSITTSSALTADDSDYNDYTTSQSGRYAVQRFVFTLQSPDTTTANIAKLTATWNGKGSKSGSNGVTLYVWNVATGSYTQLATNSVSTDETLTGDITSVGNYITSTNKVTLLVKQNGTDDGTNHAKIETDYVKLVVDPAV
jgi:hypothetical protein